MSSKLQELSLYHFYTPFLDTSFSFGTKSKVEDMSSTYFIQLFPNFIFNTFPYSFKIQEENHGAKNFPVVFPTLSYNQELTFVSSKDIKQTQQTIEMPSIPITFNFTFHQKGFNEESQSQQVTGTPYSLVPFFNEFLKDSLEGNIVPQFITNFIPPIITVNEKLLAIVSNSPQSISRVLPNFFRKLGELLGLRKRRT